MNKRVVLYDVDSKIPNLALMKISSLYKGMDYEVILSRQIQYIKGSRYFASTVFHVPKSLFNSHLSEDYKIFRMIRKLRLIPFLQEYWPIPGVPARVPEDYFDCDLDAVIRPLRFDCRRIEGYFAGLCW